LELERSPAFLSADDGENRCRYSVHGLLTFGSGKAVPVL
jgi:hypothetical protein